MGKHIVRRIHSDNWPCLITGERCDREGLFKLQMVGGAACCCGKSKATTTPGVLCDYGNTSWPLRAGHAVVNHAPRPDRRGLHMQRVEGPGRMNWCESCRYWGRERAHQHDTPYGSCRVQSPHAGKMQALPYHDPDRPSAAGPIVERGAWPWTAFDDWCGEHKEQSHD